MKKRAFIAKTALLANGLLLQGEISMGLYTDSVPVLTAERLAEIASHKWDYDMTPHIKLSAHTDVLAIQDDVIPRLSVRVWRREFPQAVQEFVDAAVKLLGSKACCRFDKQLLFLLNDKNELSYTYVPDQHWRPQYTVEAKQLLNLDPKSIAPFTPDLFMGKYRHVPQDLADAFADHFLASLHGVLSHLPAGSFLQDDLNVYINGYDRTPYLYKHLHTDGAEIVIMPYSDPGTPFVAYPAHTSAKDIRQCADRNEIAGRASYRTKAGDVSIHGTSALHTFSTMCPEAGQERRPRFVQTFSVVRDNAP